SVEELLASPLQPAPRIVGTELDRARQVEQPLLGGREDRQQTGEFLDPELSLELRYPFPAKPRRPGGVPLGERQSGFGHATVELRRALPRRRTAQMVLRLLVPRLRPLTPLRVRPARRREQLDDRPIEIDAAQIIVSRAVRRRPEQRLL